MLSTSKVSSINRVASIEDVRALKREQKLKLVTARGPARPYKTFYFDSDRGGGWSTRGASVTEKGAIRASVVRVFEGEHRRAEIYEPATSGLDVLIYTVRHTSGGLRIDYGSAG